MARPQQRKARKDYPDEGIKKGDLYWYVSIKTGPRSSRVMRSLKKFRPSQLTTSPFLSGWYATQEAFDDAIIPDSDTIRSAAEDIRGLGEEARESFDNMPEGLQQGDTGQMLEARADGADACADELEDLADEWDSLEEPEEPNEDDFEDEEEFERELDAYEEERRGWEGETGRIIDDAIGLLGEVPE